MQPNDEAHIRHLMNVHALILDPPTNTVRCGVCTGKSGSEPFVALTNVADVSEVTIIALHGHINSARHLSGLERWQGVAEGHVHIELNGTPVLVSHSIIFPDVIFGRDSTLFDLTAQALLLPNEIGALTLFANHRYLVVRLELPGVDDRPPAEPAPAPFRRHTREINRQWQLRKLPTVHRKGEIKDADLSANGTDDDVTAPTHVAEESAKCGYESDGRRAVRHLKRRREDANEGLPRVEPSDEDVVFLADGNDAISAAEAESGAGPVYAGLYPSDAQHRIGGINHRIRMEYAHRLQR